MTIECLETVLPFLSPSCRIQGGEVCLLVLFSPVLNILPDINSECAAHYVLIKCSSRDDSTIVIVHCRVYIALSTLSS